MLYIYNKQSEQAEQLFIVCHCLLLSNVLAMHIFRPVLHVTSVAENVVEV